MDRKDYGLFVDADGEVHLFWNSSFDGERVDEIMRKDSDDVGQALAAIRRIIWGD